MDLIEQYCAYLTHEQNCSPRTVYKARWVLGAWRSFCADMAVATQEEARAYLAHLRRKGWQPNTIRTTWAVVRSFCHWLEANGHHPTAGGVQVKLKTAQLPLPQVLPAKLVRQLVEAPDLRTHLGRRDRAVMELLSATGMRPSELIGLRLGDVDFPRHEVRVTGKGNKQRVIPLLGNAATWMKRWLEQDRANFAVKTDAVFVTHHGKAMGYGTVKLIVKGCAARAVGETGGIYARRFRHTIATSLLAADMNVMALRDFLGHANVATTQIYAQVAASQVKKQYARAMGLKE